MIHQISPSSSSAPPPITTANHSSNRISPIVEPFFLNATFRQPKPGTFRFRHVQKTAPTAVPSPRFRSRPISHRRPSCLSLQRNQRLQGAFFAAAGDDGDRVSPPGEKPAESGIMSGKRVFSVRLGKFRSSNVNVSEGGGETSGCVSVNSSLDNRRCFSMGSYQYIVAESDLVVALCPNKDGLKSSAEGKKLNMRSKGESFSVSKIWQWSNKRSKFANQGETNLVGASSYACSASGSGRVVAGLSLNGRRFQGP
ncbi:Uncharacterized protein Rs2_45881 [Raphanus sativus]|nr:Uncharacterized protein Rs2_45881 [Raphanus sativus]